MTTKPVRVYAEPTLDNRDDPPLTVDLFINCETNSVVGRQPVFGMQGKFSQNGPRDLEPFVLYPDGTVDYGSGFDQTSNDRLGKLDIRNQTIATGTLITQSSINYPKKIYRIVTVSDLPVPRLNWIADGFCSCPMSFLVQPWPLSAPIAISMCSVHEQLVAGF